MAKEKQPRVVAELGRPETPAETAARKAENSRLYRSRKTVNNLVFSLLVTVGLVAVIALLVPRVSSEFSEHSIDVSAVAAQAGADRPLAIPDVPETWKAKQASLTYENGVSVWQILYTTENERFASVVQAFTDDGAAFPDGWISDQLEGQSVTGDETLGSTNWQVYDHQERSPDKVNMRFGLSTAIDDNTVLVYGTDSDAVIRVLATQVADSLEGTQ